MIITCRPSKWQWSSWKLHQIHYWVRTYSMPLPILHYTVWARTHSSTLHCHASLSRPSSTLYELHRTVLYFHWLQISPPSLYSVHYSLVQCLHIKKDMLLLIILTHPFLSINVKETRYLYLFCLLLALSALQRISTHFLLIQSTIYYPHYYNLFLIS